MIECQICFSAKCSWSSACVSCVAYVLQMTEQEKKRDEEIGLLFGSWWWWWWQWCQRNRKALRIRIEKWKQGRKINRVPKKKTKLQPPPNNNNNKNIVAHSRTQTQTHIPMHTDTHAILNNKIKQIRLSSPYKVRHTNIQTVVGYEFVFYCKFY